MSLGVGSDREGEAAFVVINVCIASTCYNIALSFRAAANPGVLYRICKFSGPDIASRSCDLSKVDDSNAHVFDERLKDLRWSFAPRRMDNEDGQLFVKVQ